MSNLIKSFSYWIADKIFEKYYTDYEEENNTQAPTIYRDEEYFKDYFKSKDKISLSYAIQEQKRINKINKINKINLRLIEN